MKQTTLKIPSIGLKLLSLCAVATLLCSCAVITVKKTWKNPNVHKPVTKLAVITIEDRGLVREGFENRFVSHLAKVGTPAFATVNQLSLAEIKQDKRATAERFLGEGADAVLILRLMDSATFYREIQPGMDRWTGAVTDVGYVGWYPYYAVSYDNMAPTYGMMKQEVYLETAVYDLKTEQRMWSGVIKVVVKDSTDKLAEVDPFVAKVIAAMQKDGVVR